MLNVNELRFAFIDTPAQLLNQDTHTNASLSARRVVLLLGQFQFFLA
jgi:hypothetical protein